MSNVVSALNAVSSTGIAQVSELGLAGMITLRGTLEDAGFAAAVTAATGCEMPGLRGITSAGDNSLAWMSPDELLWLCPHDQAQQLADDLAQALSGQHAMVSNVSDARALFEVSGPAAREVLAKLCPVDMSPAAFAQGQLRRTHMAQIPAAIWMSGDTSVRVICFRSVAQYAFDLLTVAAQDGSHPHLWS